MCETSLYKATIARTKSGRMKIRNVKRESRAKVGGMYKKEEMVGLRDGERVCFNRIGIDVDWSG